MPANLPARLCLVIIIGVPAATPKEFKNTASYAFGDFHNCQSIRLFCSCLTDSVVAVTGWPSGYAFILSFLAPLWAIGMVLIYVLVARLNR